MVEEKFLKLVGKFKLSTYVGVEDFADRLNFIFSVAILAFSMAIVTVKSYFFKPLDCYMSTEPGLNFINYVESYCWGHGTFVLLPGEIFPQTPDEWAKVDETRRTTYYQWIPLILGLQCIMFYVPRIIWKLIYYNEIGTNLENLVIDANNANNDPPEGRKGKVERIARTIEAMLSQHRDYRQGKMAKVRRKLYEMCNFGVFSKHMGTWSVLSYLFMKILYGLNVIGQLFLIKRLLGSNSSVLSFGNTVSNNMVDGREWHQNGIFPRVTYCYLGEIRHLGANNRYIAQCALPINILSEKIYIFLWFWVSLVGIATAISILVWLLRLAFLSRKSSFVKKLLLMHGTYDRSDKQLVKVFIEEFLHHDGVFLIRMIYINAGDIITADIVNRLWQIYKGNDRHVDFDNFTTDVKPVEFVDYSEKL